MTPDTEMAQCNDLRAHPTTVHKEELCPNKKTKYCVNSKGKSEDYRIKSSRPQQIYTVPFVKTFSSMVLHSSQLISLLC